MSEILPVICAHGKDSEGARERDMVQPIWFLAATLYRSDCCEHVQRFTSLMLFPTTTFGFRGTPKGLAPEAHFEVGHERLTTPSWASKHYFAQIAASFIRKAHAAPKITIGGDCMASRLADPAGHCTLRQFCAETGLSYGTAPIPCIDVPKI